MKRPSASRPFPPGDHREPAALGHGRVAHRSIALLPVEALSDAMRATWPSIRAIARVTRKREYVRAGRIVRTETETTCLITSLSSQDPEVILRLNRNHWRIEAMHRDKDVCLGEDGYTNRLDHAPRNIFTLISAVRTLLKRMQTSPTRAIEFMQEDRNNAIRIIAGQHKSRFL